MLARGDSVIGTTRDGQSDMNAGGGMLHILALEITDSGAIEATVERSFALAESIDVVVNNAGYGLLGAIEEATNDEVQKLFDVNVFGPFRLIRAFLPRLRAQGSEHINHINRGSRADGVVGPLRGRQVGNGRPVTESRAGGRTARDQSHCGRARRLSHRLPERAFDTPQRGRRRGGLRRDGGQGARPLDAIGGRQIGDPGRGATAIIAAVEAQKPPLHLLLGSDAFGRARAKLAATASEIDLWESTTLGTDFQKESDVTPDGWSLEGQVAIVTGAARGIGLATAELLHARGAKVVASDLSETVHELGGSGYATLIGDVADEEVARHSVALASELFGRLDILVNNAGASLTSRFWKRA